MTLEPLAAGAWVEERLRQALADLEVVAREVEQLHGALHGQRQVDDDLHQRVALLDARTQRHETGQEIALGLRGELAELAERIQEEGNLRRDQTLALERAHRRELEVQQLHEQVLERLERRLEELDAAQAAAEERHQRLVDEVGAGERGERELTEQVALLGARLDTLNSALVRAEAAGARAEDALPHLRLGIEALDQRAQLLQAEQARLDDGLRALQMLADREAMLADLLEQQRALRAHVEERLRGVEGRLEGMEAALLQAAEERRALLQYVSRAEEGLQALGDRAEAQRQSLLDHFRRMTVTAEAFGRRQSEEIELQVRAGRELLVRLAEGSEAATQERPL